MICRATVQRLVFVASFLPWLFLAVILIAHQHNSLAPPDRVPFDFGIVERRYGELRLFDSREKVEAILGPPTHMNEREGELNELERALENAGRNPFMPKVRVWDKWTDSKDVRKWVAVLYNGDQSVDKVYYLVKKGF